MDKKQGILITLASGVLVALLFFILFSDSGLLDLIRLKKDHHAQLERNRQLEEETRNMRTEIQRLKTDPGYIETIARRELGMIAPDEIIVKPDDSANR
jgi:cell division protein FtsB